MSEKKKVNLKDIARDLGISVSTASRALNGYDKISGETIKMVKDYAEKHHYTPNLLAVNLRKTGPQILEYSFLKSFTTSFPQLSAERSIWPRNMDIMCS